MGRWSGELKKCEKGFCAERKCSRRSLEKFQKIEVSVFVLLFRSCCVEGEEVNVIEGRDKD